MLRDRVRRLRRAGRQLQKTMCQGNRLNTGPQRVRAPYLNAHGLPIASPK